VSGRGAGAGRSWLERMLDAVIGVLGGSGGVGSSTFAAALADAAGQATLVDLDPVGGGVDVLLGIEDLPGARWSALHLDGGYLDPAQLAGRLPRRRGVAVLAADVAPPGPGAVEQVVAAAAESGPVVLDLPRAPSPVRDAGLEACTLCVVVAAAEVRALVAAGAVLRSLPDVPTGVVLRRGGLATVEAMPLLGVPLLGVLPPADRAGGAPRAAARIASGVLDGLVA
jgi:secretion/DNA translocation related CpaE-like protein